MLSFTEIYTIKNQIKTKFAKLLFEFYKAYGILAEDGVFVEKNGTDMKGSTIGTSGPRVKAAVKRAIGGCLFIDEAYSLADGDGPPETTHNRYLHFPVH